MNFPVPSTHSPHRPRVVVVVQVAIIKPRPSPGVPNDVVTSHWTVGWPNPSKTSLCMEAVACKHTQVTSMAHKGLLLRQLNNLQLLYGHCLLQRRTLPALKHTPSPCSSSAPRHALHASRASAGNTPLNGPQHGQGNAPGNDVQDASRPVRSHQQAPDAQKRVMRSIGQHVVDCDGDGVLNVVLLDVVVHLLLLPLSFPAVHHCNLQR